jgi:methyl-accepting chemotaxis protein
MALANLRVSRKLALGLGCVLVAFVVTGVAFFAALLSLDRANVDLASASTLTRHVMRATSALYEESLAGGDAARQEAAKRFSDGMGATRRVVENYTEQSAILAEIVAMGAAAATWRQ